MLFIAGLLVGGFIGMLIMALCVAAGEADRRRGCK